MIPPRHFYMIRHGETEANANRVMAGSLDSPLTARGRQQAENARHIIEQLETKPAAIIHSNLSRARDTAKIINTNLGLPLSEEPDLAEIHVGELEGASWDICHNFDLWRDPPGGETFEIFFERVKRAKKKIFENHGGPVLIVSHGGVFKALWKIYGHNMEGVRNCHLHEFEPALSQGGFPWNTYVYDYDHKIRRTGIRYHDDDVIAR